MKAQAEIMTYAEMEAAFDGEWVLIGEPDLTPMNEVIRGAVLFHSRSRDEVYREAMQRSLKRVAILYIGARRQTLTFFCRVSFPFNPHGGLIIVPATLGGPHREVIVRLT